MLRTGSRSSLPLPVASLLIIVVAAPIASLAGAAPSNGSAAASGARISAHLTQRSFRPGEAGLVKLIYKFSKPCRSFSYRLSRANTSKWPTIRTVRKKSTFKGSNSMTVMRVFAGTPVKTGRYRLVLSCGGPPKRLGFTIVRPLTRSAPNRSAFPITVEGITSALMVDASGAYSCALLSEGTIDCWGDDEFGQLGDGVNEHKHGILGGGGDYSPTPVQVSGITDATEVDAGSRHSCAVLSSGTIDCWGANTTGQLGDGTNQDRSTPVPVTGITNAVQVSAGNHTCAVLTSGAVECWGPNFEGQLGNGTNQNSSTPVQVAGITSAVAVSVGDFFSCAVISDGTVECWGDNASGQLGDGLKDHGHQLVDIDDFSPTPVAASGITRAIAVSTGSSYACALLSDGTVQCWGSGGAIKLSDAPAPTPVAVEGIADADGLSAGAFHACALLSDGTVQCWGYNSSGQFGNGTEQSSSTPVSVVGITNATDVGAGLNHTCAVLSSGSIECWGQNKVGQLGSDKWYSTALGASVSEPNVLGGGKLLARPNIEADRTPRRR
jgi:alpha-tubulin suppressor-like RCC1 family protein